MQALLHTVAGDFFGDGRTGLALSGRNYEAQEAFVHVLYWDGSDFTSVWQSENVWVDASPVAITAGDFLGTGRVQLAVLTVDHVRLFQWDGQTMELVHEGPGPEAPLEIGALRHPQHEHELIAVTRRHRVDGLTPLLGVELWGWLGNGLHPLWETPTIGRVRAIAPRARDGDGMYDFVLDVGEGMGPGDLHVWTWNASGYEKTFSKPLRSTPTFGLTTAVLDDEDVLIAADDRGYVSVHALEGDMPLLGQSVSLGWALVSAAAGDFFGDGGLQAVVAGYPDRLHVVELMQP